MNLEDPGTAVLLMGYGSPTGPEDLPGYLTEVLGGRSPSPAMVREYERRYALIGGSPQNRILESLRRKLESALATDDASPRVFLGTKHWKPNVATVLPEAVREGFHHFIAIPLSPFASTWILEPYRQAIEEGRKASGGPLSVELREGWHLEPHLIQYWAEAIRRSLEPLPAERRCVLLSAHSLPKRFRDRGDPYPEILQETSNAIVTEGKLDPWAFTYQSPGNDTEPWLGPDITDVLLDWHRRGRDDALIAPFGFVFEHLEVLYDLDIVVREFATRHGIRYHRVPMPNDSPQLVQALAAVARGSRSARTPATVGHRPSERTRA
jgi:ferrochelatase